jgi:2-oxoglutarate dehydrogenase E1 component
MILDRLVWSDSFERFVSTKYPSEKRFGLEGGESLIPGMKALVSALTDLFAAPIVRKIFDISIPAFTTL